MADQLDGSSGNIFEKIAQLGREFGKQLSQGKSPKIERFLSQLPVDAQANLFANLIASEVNYRQRKGESPSSDEYVKRFPQYKREVRRAFFEPSMVSVDSGSDTDLTESIRKSGNNSSHVDVTYDFPEFNQLGDYELIRKLGQGGMGIVYEARHIKTNNRVALKTLLNVGAGQQVNADKLYRFRKEFRRLSEINHPNLVGMQSLEVDGDNWFFTMDLIDGVDFLSYVRPNDQIDESRLRSCLKQLAAGVMELHGRGIIHRDLKPSNVLVAEDGHLTILDFGLASQLQRTGDMTFSKSGVFSGTPPYAAPEQMFGERTEASDWYAVGTMLFEALAGERPFSDADPMALLKRKQEEDPPQLSSRMETPDDLTALADGMLRREPGLRLTNDSIVNLLDIQEETRIPGSTRESQGSVGSIDAEDADLGDNSEEETVLVGREEQLDQLDSILQDFLETGKPKVAWVTGKSGEGKSSLVDAFLRPLRRGTDMLVLSGRCYDRESVPFKAIDCFIDPLVRYLRRCSDDELAQLLPEDVGLLAKLFPSLNRVRQIEERVANLTGSIDSKQVRYRAFEALRELLASIGHSIPIVLFIDDLQWGDADSAAALHALLFSDSAPPLLFLGAYRSDEIEASTFHRHWKQLAQEKQTLTCEKMISISPLNQEECVALVMSQSGMLECDAKALVSELYASTRGNPYFVEQLLEGVRFGATNWKALPLEDMIAQKIIRLPKGSQRLLEWIAVSGKATRVAELESLCDAENTVLPLLTHMRNERLVRLVGSGEDQLVDTWHDKIRESILETMDRELLRSLHLRFAEAIEVDEVLNSSIVEDYLAQPFTNQESPEFSTSRVYDLAYHFNLAGDRRALRYQFLAGELAFRNYASEEAIEFLNRASEMLLGNEPKRWLSRLWHRLATSSYRVIEFDTAIEQFGYGLRYAESGLERALFYTGIATVQQTRTDYESAAEYHDLALKEIGRKRPKGVSAVLTTALASLKLGVFPESWVRGRFLELTEETRLEHSIYCDMVQYLFDRFIPVIEYPAAVAKLGVLSHRFDMDEFASGVGLLSGHLGISGFPRTGRRHARRAVARINDRTDPEAEGICRYMVGIALSYSAEFEEAQREFKVSVPLLIKSGSHFHCACALHMWRHLHEGVSSARREVETASKLIELTSNSGNLRSLCWGQYDLAGGFARLGNLSEALSMIKQAETTAAEIQCNLTTPIFLANKGFVALQASRYHEARVAAVNSWKTAVKHLRVMDVSLRGLPWYLEAVAGPNWASEPLEFETRLVRRRCRFARILALAHVKIRPHLFRSRGRAFIALGKEVRGLHNLEQAVASARSLGMKYDLGRALLDLAAVKKDGRDENRAEAICLLKEMESVIPRAESWLLGDQYDESVVAPEFDLAAWEREHGPISALPEDLS